MTTNQAETGESSLTAKTQSPEDECVFDELAMLCSGQFETVQATAKQTTTQPLELEKISEETKSQTESTLCSSSPYKQSKKNEIKLDDNDLYAADGDDEEDDNLMKRIRNEVLLQSDDSNSNQDKNEKENEESKGEDEEGEESKEEDEESKEESKEEEEDEEGKEDEEDKEESKKEEKLKKKKTFEELFSSKQKIVDDQKLEGKENENFFETEAALSGSEADSDEDYEGESGDENALLSGDEDDHDHNEVKNQLEKIYLKNQLDEDKKQMRLFKEMYLADGDMHGNKASRKKQFRWKNLDDYRIGNHNNTSSEDEDDEDDDDDDEDDSDKTKGGDNEQKNKEKNKHFFKMIENKNNWRTIRHEREQFVREKLVSNCDLFADEDDTIAIKSTGFGLDENDQNSNDSSSSATISGNKLMRKGQELLKQSLIIKTIQHKRKSSTTTSIESEQSLSSVIAKNYINPLSKNDDDDDDLNENQDYINDKTTITTSKSVIKSSITIQPLNTIDVTLKPKSKQNDQKSDSPVNKFSFLNRDRSYLSRLSNYVNKNFAHELTTTSSKSARSNNMVFSSVNQNNSNEANNENSIAISNKMVTDLVN
jgi:hypothetical protein